MAVDVKICGLNSLDAVEAAVDGGAAYVGLVFYQASPRAVTLDHAAKLADAVPSTVRKVGLFVDEPNETFARVLDHVPLDMLQLHGAESPERVSEIRDRFGLPVIKAIRLGTATDLAAADVYANADHLLFDAKPPPEMAGALPGGNAISFDWRLLAGHDWPTPWLLSGGLTAANLVAAVRASGARAVDVSSGVEERPGVKSSHKIANFLKLAQNL